MNLNVPRKQDCLNQTIGKAKQKFAIVGIYFEMEKNQPLSSSDSWCFFYKLYGCSMLLSLMIEKKYQDKLVYDILYILAFFRVARIMCPR